MNIEFLPLSEVDIEALTPIMTRAFDHDAMVNTGVEHAGPPGYDDGSFLQTWGLHPEATAFRIMVNGQLAGAVILWIRHDHENRLGCIFLEPDLCGLGLGTRIWQRIEALYPQTRIWRTDTVLTWRSNLAYYVNKCGFHVVGITFTYDLPDASVELEKVMA